MGYRSDVRIIFYALKDENFVAVKLWVDENCPGKDDDFMYEVRNHGNRRVIMYDLESVKWYPDYADVKKMEAALVQFSKTFDDAESMDAAYEFIRIGEEDEDVERKSSDKTDYLLTINRTIEWV